MELLKQRGHVFNKPAGTMICSLVVIRLVGRREVESLARIRDNTDGEEMRGVIGVLLGQGHTAYDPNLLLIFISIAVR